eukprot:gene28451-35270_t
MTCHELPKLKDKRQGLLDQFPLGFSCCGEEFLDNENVTGEHKSAEFMAELIVKYVKIVKDHEFIVKKLRDKQFLHAELFRAQASEELKPLFTTH